MIDPWILFLFIKITSTVGLFVVIALIILVLLKQKAFRTAQVLFLSTLSMAFVVTVLKLVLQVPRPPDALISASGYAFPSGHAAGATFLALVLITLAWRLPFLMRASIIFVCVSTAFAIALSRILFNVHTLWQVLAGATIGLLFAVLFIYFNKARWNFQKH